MRYLAVATDFDGTLAHNGRVTDDTWTAVARLRESGRKVILVTGRELPDLQNTCPHLDRFDRIVAENGGLIYRPATREERLLAPPPAEAFIQLLRERGVRPMSVGKTIVATWEPHETTVLRTIRDLGLELQVIFNKGAVMVLPSGVNKATGLAAALGELELSPHNVIGIGDAENDHAFLALCECSAAVANALATVKEHADIVTTGDHGAGVVEMIDALLADDLKSTEGKLIRHHILLGHRQQTTPEGDRDVAVLFPPHGTSILVAGPSGSGKSTVTTGLLERLAEAGYQFCAVDPEGDYEKLDMAVTLGTPSAAPAAEQVLNLLRQSGQNVVVNLLGLSLADRPRFFTGLLPRLQELRTQTGRPHWLVIDEAHHLLPVERDAAPLSLPQQLENVLVITVHPDTVSPAVLKDVSIVLAVGGQPEATLKSFASALQERAPSVAVEELDKGEVVAWIRGEPHQAPFRLRTVAGKTERRRHSRKYAEGELPPERSFFFRGLRGKLNLRSHNLIQFLELAQGVDTDTWLHHLRQGDYSRWFREAIKDKALAEEAQRVEREQGLSAAESQARIRAAVEAHYTLPATTSSGIESQKPRDEKLTAQ